MTVQTAQTPQPGLRAAQLDTRDATGFDLASSCPSCGSARMIRLDLQLTDGTPVVFTSCRGCERRWYVGPEGDLAVGDVLARTVKPGKGSVPARPGHAAAH